jgi:hypothetical protein
MRDPIAIQPDKLFGVLQENVRQGYHFHVGSPGHAATWFLDAGHALDYYKLQHEADKTIVLYRCKGECVVYKTPRVPQACPPLQVEAALTCPRCEMPCKVEDQLARTAFTALQPCRVCNHPHDNAQWKADLDYYVRHGAKEIPGHRVSDVKA